MKGRHSNNPRAQAKKVDAFLDAYERCGMIRTAAKAVGIAHNNHHNWLVAVPGYAERFAAAHARAVATLAPRVEAELIKRAIEGVRTLVIDRGAPVEVWVNPDGEIVPAPKDVNKPGDLKKALYWEVKKSDGLLMFLLKSLDPEKYGDKQKVAMTGANGGPIETTTTHKFDHARFAELFRSRFGGAGSGDGAAPANGN